MSPRPDHPSVAPLIAPAKPSVDVMEDERVEIDQNGDHERFSHIIRKSDEMKGYALGEEVTALCGKKWVPSRDPQKFPVCPTCLEVLAAIRAAGGN